MSSKPTTFISVSKNKSSKLLETFVCSNSLPACILSLIFNANKSSMTSLESGNWLVLSLASCIISPAVTGALNKSSDSKLFFSKKFSPNNKLKSSVLFIVFSVSSLSSSSDRKSAISLSTSSPVLSLASTPKLLVLLISIISSCCHVSSNSGVSPSNKSARVFNSANPTSGPWV
ncbi:hypothetical protein NIES23_47230 [Trichormus variabilis NIES-23]|uniref:Uncharacterized protein n=1 Tax=Trichormus variabilis NIES-23 TaxID=1973479 RepID=A0A1Z4KSC0_ANAVA|nr:hypothetical protein NIES23_47230 [Trichormus variabilis NIES-23]